MSLFGAMNTAVSGLTAQSAAFGNISENVANSQTTGYKAVDTSFIDYLTASDATENVPGDVVATPVYENNVQGTISQSSDPLALAISGQGFFAVSEQTGSTDGQPIFDSQQYYTRAGDFQLDKNGYLVNSAGEFLNGWAVTNGVVNQNTLAPIQVSQTVFDPIATDNIALSANLPASPASGTGVPAIYTDSGATTLYGVITTNLTAAAAGPDSGTATAQAALNTATLDSEAANDALTVLTNNGANATPASVLAAITGDATPGVATSNAAIAATTAAAASGATAESVITAAMDVAANSAGIACTAAGATVTSPTFNPATDYVSAAVPISSQINVYDALGTAHTVTLNWVQTTTNQWTVQIAVPDNTTALGSDVGSADVTFGNGSTAGTVTNLVTDANDPGSVTTNPPAAGGGGAATLSFACDFGSGTQNITVNLGTYGQATGLTQYAGTQYNLRGLTQNGVPPGAFSSVTTSTNGDVSVNYDNGQSRVVAQVPVITFNAPNQLQSQDGQAYTVAPNSGAALAESAGSNGAGALVTQSVEGSNVDIASEFTQLIVAQQAYSANARMVTTAQQMLQTTVDMKQ